MLEQILLPIEISGEYKPHQIGYSIKRYESGIPDLDNIRIALIGIEFNDITGDKESSPNAIREEFYSLSDSICGSVPLIDLGNIKNGKSKYETGVAIEMVTSMLLEVGVLPVFFGGSVDFSQYIFNSLNAMQENIELTYCSSEVPLLKDEVLNSICVAEPNNLYNLNLLGYQRHKVPSKALEVIDKLGFNHYRLGQLKRSIESAEPLLRNTDITIIDMNSVSQTFSPGSDGCSPAGFDTDMICQIGWYAGISDLNTCLGIFNFIPGKDRDGATAKLVSLIVWYFVEGYANRKNDHPTFHQEFYKYRCHVTESSPDIIFYKSKRSDRWWMEAPFNSSSKTVYVPCSYKDYQMATNGELPNRFLKTLQHTN